MDLRTCVQYLLDNGYAIITQNQVVLTKKLNEELKGKSTITQVPTKVETVVVTNLDDKKAVWNKFIEDAEIPHRVNSPHGGTYTVRQYSQQNANKLARIIAAVDYNRLVESTKNYYKTVSYKALLSNYLDKDIWKHEYDSWTGQAVKSNQNDGTNRFED